MYYLGAKKVNLDSITIPQDEVSNALSINEVARENNLYRLNESITDENLNNNKTIFDAIGDNEDDTLVINGIFDKDGNHITEKELEQIIKGKQLNKLSELANAGEQTTMGVEELSNLANADTKTKDYQEALSRILLSTLDTIEDVEADIELIENAYNASPDDETLKDIYQQVLNKLDEVAGV